MSLTPEELSAIQANLTETIMAEVHKANSGLAASVSRQIKEIAQTTQQPAQASPERQEQPLEAKALASQVAELTERLNKAEQKERSLRKANAISEVVNNIQGVKAKTTLTKLLTYELDNKLNFSDDGSKAFVEIDDSVVALDKYVTDYIQNDEAFRPRKSSSVPLVKESSTTQPDKPSKEDVLNQIVSS